MTLSAERISLANLTIQRTFEQASVAWQSIAHWDTGDPGQTMVRSDAVVALADLKAGGLGGDPLGGDALKITEAKVDFTLTFAQAAAGTPDALLTAVIPRTVQLAKQFDDTVFPRLAEKAADAEANNKAPGKDWHLPLEVPADADATKVGPPILKALIGGRALLEDSGFRGPSCLVASTAHFTDLNAWQGSNVATEGLLVGGNANSVFRMSALNTVAAGNNPKIPDRMIMIGRRQQIAHGRAATATPGEEPVDLAVSVPPSLEVVGENAAGQIQLAVRIRYALRFKDERGVVVFHGK
jgi:hypothetical protein